MASSTSKELLELESRGASSAESKLLICSNKEASLPGRRKKKDPSTSRHVDGVFTAAAPQSQVLGKVKDFLGIMAEANKQLELNLQENTTSNYDIEVLNGNEAEIIEMDLLLGVADLQTPEAVTAAETAIGNFGPLSSCSNGSHCLDTDDSSIDDSSEDESGSDDSADDGERSSSHKKEAHRASNPFGTDQTNKRPKIVVLD